MRKNKMKNRIFIALSVLICSMGLCLTYAAKDKKEDAVIYEVPDNGEYEALTNRHTQYVEVEEAKCQLTTEGFEEKLNNGTLSVWYNKKMEALRVVDLRSGYVWGCVDDVDEYNLNKKWTQRSTSMLYISYFDFKGNDTSCALSDTTFRAKFSWKKESFTCNVSARKLGISFQFSGELDDDKFTLSMKDESIKETGKSKLASLSFMSFMGSVYEDTVPGYMMVPDGSGALMRFQKAKAYKNAYHRRVYGSDLSIDLDTTTNELNGNRTNDYATEENQLSFPLWGIVHGENQNAFLATIDSGELYSMINAVPAGAENETVKLSRTYADFIYRSKYNKMVSQSSRTGVAVIPEETNVVNPKLTFTFLTRDEANYSGMATEYRKQLIADNKLPEDKSEAKGDVPLLLHVAGSEVKEGFLFNGLATLTNIEQANSILDQLEKQGITNVSMLLSGWNKGGYHGASYGTTSFETQVGSKKDVKELESRLEKQGGDLALVLNVMTANEDQINIKQDVALNAPLQQMIEQIPNDSLMYPSIYYLRHAEVMKYMGKAFDDLEEFSILLEDTAKYLHADYTIGKEKTRVEVMNELVQKTETAKQDLLFDAENLYMLKYASKITDIPVSSSQYVYETDSIPFVQMVLRGSVDYYAPYSNLGFYSESSILKMIEYGVYPSFMVMHEDNFAISDTPLENYFSLRYDDWEDKIVNVYEKVNGALESVKGQAIVSHKVLASGVSCTTYENGIQIFVNYNSEDFVTEEGVTVPAGSYAVEG